MLSKKRVAITGATGLIGVPLRARLLVSDSYQPVVINRASWRDPVKLSSELKDCDILVHLAYQNRGSESDLLTINREMTKLLAKVLPRTKIRRVVFTSSSSAWGGGSYAKSKSETVELLRYFLEISDIDLKVLQVPNTFSETGRPLTNSVVATFANEIVKNLPSTVNDKATINLSDITDVCAAIFAALEGRDIPIQTRELKVSDLYVRMSNIWSRYLSGCIPNLDDRLNRSLFNVLRYVAFPGLFPIYPDIHRDLRGSLFEFFRASSEGQSFISSTEPMMERGNHFHLEKFERFCILSGEALIRVRGIFSTHITEFMVSGSKPCHVDIPTLHTHSIVNIGSQKLIAAFYTDKHYTKADNDTYHCAVDQRTRES
jgi:UDP-2-acetamido-2,6-beta-L-arabino-hexul-4-ose reductase